MISASSFTGWFDSVYACVGVPDKAFEIYSDPFNIIAKVIAADLFTSSSEEICDGDSTMIFGEFETTAGVYYDSLFSVMYCDSVEEVVLDVHPTFEDLFTPTYICPSDSSMIFGEYEMLAGIYYDSLVTIKGCDSVSIQEIILYEDYAFSNEVDVCEGIEFTLPDGGTTLVDTIHLYTLTSINGCDSLITTTVNYTIIDPTITVTSPLLTANHLGDDYQWIDCSNMSLISGATNQEFAPTDNGDYAVIVTDNGCVDTTSCETIFDLTTDEVGNSNFMIYPNPTSGKLHFQSLAQLVEVRSIDGVLHMVTQNVKTINLSNLDSGVYLIRTEFGTQRIIKK